MTGTFAAHSRTDGTLLLQAQAGLSSSHGAHAVQNLFHCDSPRYAAGREIGTVAHWGIEGVYRDLGAFVCVVVFLGMRERGLCADLSCPL